VFEKIERYRSLLTPVEIQQLMDAMERPLTPAFRVNTLKVDPAEASSSWAAWYEWRLERVPFCDTGWQVVGGGEALSRTVEHRMSLYYMQDAASMLPAELFDFSGCDDPLVLDVAASPGGKSTHLLSKLRDRGLLVSNDSAGRRLASLRGNLQGWGALSALVTNYPGEKFGCWFPDVFDYVLLDAPCSGDGLRTARRRRTRPVDDGRRESFHKRQVRLIESAFRALKPGGQLVYSTCSLAPEEDEAVVDALLRAAGPAATVESVSKLLPVPAPGAEAYGEAVFLSQVRNAVRLWPHLYDTSGAFAALLRKNDVFPGETLAAPYRSLEGASYQRLTREERERLIGDLGHTYGFDAKSSLLDLSLGLWRRDSEVYAIPRLYESRLSAFPAVSIGMMIGQLHGSDFAPSHELVSRFWDRFSGQRFQVDPDQARVWLDGRDLRGVTDSVSSPGSIVLIEDEKKRFLGSGKVLDRRIRNLLPHRLIY